MKPIDIEFKNILSRELEERTKKNSGYSLRAFARDLGIDPSNMSKILSGKIRPYPKTKERILLEIGVSVKDISKIIKNKNDIPHYKEFKQLNVEKFEAIAEWHHDAILELTKLSFFRGNYKWIAQTLGITQIKVKLAVERLIKLEYLEILDENHWVDKLGGITTNMDVNYTNQALKKRQLSVLQQSIEAVKSTNIKKRDHTSTMLAIDEEDIPYVKSEVKNFRKRMTQYLERNDVVPSQVYQLHIGFYPLSNNIGEQEL